MNERPGRASSVEERVYHRFLVELAASGAEGERVAAALRRLLDEASDWSEAALVELFERLPEDRA